MFLQATVMNNWLKQAINGMIGFKQPVTQNEHGPSWECDTEAQDAVEKFKVIKTPLTFFSPFLLFLIPSLAFSYS